MILAVAVFFQTGGTATQSAAADADSAEPTAAVHTDSEDSSPAGSHSEAHEHEHANGGHNDPIAPVLLAIALILVLAKVGGDLFERVGMPAVLGELVVGILLGNFYLFTGWHGLDFFKPPAAGSLGNPYEAGAALQMLAGIGVVLLLFEVGLESNVREMMSVGVSSLLVALLGVGAPILLGWSISWWLIPDEGWQVHAFVGATLCATSVGITARVLKDLGRSQQRESQIILGAAVIDDVLGLIVLAVVAGVISQGTVDPYGVAGIIAKAFGFLLVAVLLGNAIFTRPLFKAASYLHGHGLLVATALVICFGFAWLANVVGLAPIVGAFAAGLILERAHYRELGERGNRELEDALAPLAAILVPIFFVQMGIQVDLTSFGNPEVWGFAAAITIAAIVGKQVCSLGVRDKGLNTTAVGLGMIPRGEVGLIFAQVGKGLTFQGEPVVSEEIFSAIVVMVIVTTMITPPLLKWSLQRSAKGVDDMDGSEISPELSGDAQETAAQAATRTASATTES